MEIKKISSDLQAHLRSGFTVVSPCQAVLELVYNSLDAAAKSVAVRAELKSSYNIQVIDDGVGIDKTQMDFLGQRYMTSKCHSLEDLSSRLAHYGFRGEYLASLKQSCEEIIIMSRAKGSKKTYMKVLKTEDSPPCEESTLHRQCHGTTVIVKNLLYNYPVRQRNIKHNLELESIKKQLLDVCPMHPQVSFTIRDDTTKNVILQTKKLRTTKDQILFLISNMIKFESSLIHVQMNHKGFEIDGYISREPINQPQYQNIYVNKRLITNTILHETLNKLLVKSFYLNITKDSNKLKPDGKSKFSVYFVNIICPYKFYELIPQPSSENRTFLEFINWKTVFKVLEMFVSVFLKLEDFSNHTEKHIVEENVTNKTNDCNSKKDYQNEKIKIGTSDRANDIYSIKMIKNFKEHTRNTEFKGLEEFFEQNEEKIINANDKNEPSLVNEKNMENIPQSFDVTENHCIDLTPKNKLQQQKTVRSLQAKIKQIKEENLKKKSKEKEKIPTSFHYDQKLSCTDGKINKIDKNIGKSKSTYKVSKSHTLASKEKIPRTYKKSNRKTTSIFSKETLKLENPKRKRVIGNGNMESNEHIFTQPHHYEQRKKNNVQTETKQEPEKKDLTASESIFTGVDSHELLKNCKSVNQSDLKIIIPDRLGESCNFSKLYEVCNLKVFDWFQSVDSNFFKQTPEKETKINLTPIKLKRKNKRQEMKSILKNKRDKLNQSKPRQKNLATTLESINFEAHNHPDELNVNFLRDITKNYSERIAIPDRKIMDSVLLKKKMPEKYLCAETGSVNFYGSTRRSEETSSICQQYREIKNKDNLIDKFHKNPVVINGHFVDNFREYNKSEGNIQRNHSQVDILKLHSSKNMSSATERDYFKVRSKELTSTESKYLDRIHRTEEIKSHIETICNDVKPTVEENFKTWEHMSQEYDEEDILDSYINDILSRSYRTNLHVHSQKNSEENYLNYSYIPNTSFYREKLNETACLYPNNIREETQAKYWNEEISDIINNAENPSQTLLNKTFRMCEHYSEGEYNSNIPSPYFHPLHSKEKASDKVHFSSKFLKKTRSTRETLMSNEVKDNFRIFQPKPKKSVLGVAFFEKKFSLTPILQSSNSNNQYSIANPLFADTETPNKNHHETFAHNDVFKNNKNLMRLGYEKSTKNIYSHSEENLYALFSGNNVKNSINSFDQYEVREDGVSETLIDNDKHAPIVMENNKIWNQKNNKTNIDLRVQLMKRKSLYEKEIALLDTEELNHKEASSDLTAKNDEPHVNNEKSRFEESYINLIPDEIPITERNNHSKMKYVETWLTDVSETHVSKSRENIDETLRKEEQSSCYESNDIKNDKIKNRHFNAKISNNELDDTQINFERHNVMEPCSSNVRHTVDFEDIPQNLTRENISYQDIDKAYSSKFDKLDVDKRLETPSTEKRITEPPYEEVASSLADTIERIARENALADTQVIVNNQLPEELVDGKSIYLPDQVAVESFVFNPLGIVAGSNPEPVTMAGSFHLKDRYGFMDKGLSPLVLSNKNRAEVGQLGGLELEVIEQMMPSPREDNGLDNNCIDKIVGLEEILVKTHLKSSLMNSMCHVTKDLFNVTFKVIAQLDRKYILVLLNKTLLVALDQHAVDERIRVEKLLSYYRNEENGGSFISHPITPCVLNLSAQELNTLSNRETCLHYYGLLFQMKENARCVKVTHVPKCLYVKVQKETNAVERQKMTRALVLDLIREILFNKSEARIMPSSLMDIINMEACRGAIMFGQSLPLPTCYTLVKSLTRCKAPFQCAHGRPSVAPLADVKLIAALVASRSRSDSP